MQTSTTLPKPKQPPPSQPIQFRLKYIVIDKSINETMSSHNTNIANNIRTVVQDDCNVSVVDSTYAASDFDGFQDTMTSEPSIRYATRKVGDLEEDEFVAASRNFDGECFVIRDDRIDEVEEEEPSIGEMCIEEDDDVTNDGKEISSLTGPNQRLEQNKKRLDQDQKNSSRYSRLKQYNSWQKTRQSSQSPAPSVDRRKDGTSNVTQKEKVSPHKTYESRRSRLDKLKVSSSPSVNRFRSRSPSMVSPPPQASSPLNDQNMSNMTPLRLNERFSGHTNESNTSLDISVSKQVQSNFGNDNDVSMYTPPKKGYTSFHTPDAKDISVMIPGSASNLPSSTMENSRIKDKLKILHRAKFMSSHKNTSDPQSPSHENPRIQVTVMDGVKSTEHGFGGGNTFAPQPSASNSSTPRKSPPRYTSVGYLMNEGKVESGNGFTYSFEESVDRDTEQNETIHHPVYNEVNNYVPPENTISPVDITIVASGKSATYEASTNQSKTEEKQTEWKPKQQDDHTVSSIVSGNETLSSWWQSTYAKTQTPDVNSAVEKMLSPNSDVDEDDEDIFSGIDAPDDETFGDIDIAEASISTNDKVGSYHRNIALHGSGAARPQQSTTGRLELVQEVSEEEYGDSPQKSSSSHVEKLSSFGISSQSNFDDSARNGYQTSPSSMMRNGNERNDFDRNSINLSKGDYHGHDRHVSKNTRLDHVLKEAQRSGLSDEDDYTNDATTFDLENPTIPEEWGQRSPDKGKKTKVFSFAELGCSVLDTVTLKACVVPTDEKGRRQLCKCQFFISLSIQLSCIDLLIYLRLSVDAKKKQIMTLLGNKFSDTQHDESQYSEDEEVVNSNLSYSTQNERRINKSNSVEDVALAGLTVEERRVWDDWDRKNIDSPGPKDLESSMLFDTSADVDEANIVSADHTERRKQAHQELKQQAKYATDTVERTPTRAKSSELNNARKADTSLIHKKQTTKVHTNQFSLSHQQFLEKFDSVLKTRGLEVLKLNTNNKWELRFLTVTKEILWLKQGSEDNTGDRMHVPQGLLWLKKFSSKTKDQSITAIDKQGRGGMLFPHIISTTISSSSDNSVPIPSKFLSGKFNSSILLTLVGTNATGSPRTIHFSFMSKEDAKLFCSGCNLISELTKKK